MKPAPQSKSPLSSSDQTKDTKLEKLFDEMNDFTKKVSEEFTNFSDSDRDDESSDSDSSSFSFNDNEESDSEFKYQVKHPIKLIFTKL